MESRCLLSGSTFQFDPPAGSPPHTLTFFLDSPTVPSGASLEVRNADTGQSVATETSFTTGTWSGGATASFTFPDVNGGILPDGNYYGLLVNANPSTQLQQSLGQADFFVLAGDANHDRAVNALDFNALATNYGRTNATFSQGDFNYDGTIDSSDFSILAMSYGKTLMAPRPVPVAGTVATFNSASSAIDLSWAANPESGVTYNIYRGTDLEFIPDPSINRIASGLTGATDVDSAVSANTRYYYHVTAVVSGQESFANELASQITAVGQQPTNLDAEAADEQRIELSWDDATSDEVSYTAEVLDSSNNVVQSATLPADSTSYAFDGLSEQTDYTLSVTANFTNNSLAPQAGTTTTASTQAADAMVGLIIIMFGHFQSYSDHSAGMNTLTSRLRNDNFLGSGLHYRVWRVNEYVFASGGEGVTWNGFGTVYDDALSLLHTNSVRDVAIIGYSHGGGIVHSLAQNLLAARSLGETWGIRYAATIDAIQRGPIDNWLPAFAETHLPQADLVHNFYNVNDFDLFKNPLKGDSIPQATNTALFDDHRDIQNDPTMQNDIDADIRNRILNA